MTFGPVSTSSGLLYIDSTFNLTGQVKNLSYGAITYNATQRFMISSAPSCRITAAAILVVVLSLVSGRDRAAENAQLVPVWPTPTGNRCPSSRAGFIVKNDGNSAHGRTPFFWNALSALWSAVFGTALD
jgi:hypothetical protein